MKFNNEAYKEVMKCLVGDIFYTNNLSITSRISIIRRYSEIILRKLDKTKKKYPVEKAKGVSTKYNKL